MRSHRLLLGVLVAAVAMSCLGVEVWATTLREEVELGQKLDEQILKQTPLIADKQALAQIDEYGQNLVKNINRREIQYHLRIIKDPDFNAFAVPGGYVYFTERLWEVLRKDERIGVLAHEIVHVDRRHTLDAISKQQRRQLWLAVLLTAVNANQTWGDITGLLHNIYSLKYSRADERQADDIGVQLAYKAGYNPAGLLMAMRKIGRFQSESGGEPPKIFSDHPPTPERMQYLEEILVKMGVPVPPDKPVREEVKYRLGDVTAVTRNKVEFVSSKPLHQGDVVWLMKPGWDFYYEKHTSVPAARAVVSSQTAGTYSADFTLLPKARAADIVKGIGVHDPPRPKPEQVSARLEPGSPGRIVTSQSLKRLERFLAKEAVWNKDRTELTYEGTGYLVVTNPSSPTGYVATARPDYGYSPLSSGADLVQVSDANKDRWLGAVISIGRGGETIELATERDSARLTSDLNSGRRFDVVCPPWDPKERYADRVAGKAVLKSLGSKIVMKMLSYSPGWSISNLETGFDIYEPRPQGEDSQDK